jgi:hypothetical protein
MLEAFEKERAALLLLLQNRSAPVMQRMEAVRMLGDMIRGQDHAVVELLLQCVRCEVHPIMRALAITSLRHSVDEWDEALKREILPCLVDVEQVVRKAAVDALLLKVKPPHNLVKTTSI